MLIAFVLSGFVALVAALANWHSAWRALRGRKAPSPVPLVGGLAGAVAMLTSPWEGTSSLWWLPFLLDWGSIPVAVYAGAWHLLHRNGK